MVVESQGPGWARQASRRNPFAHLHGFLGFLFAQAGVYLHERFLGFLPCVELVCAFCRGPEKGREVGGS